MPDYSYPYPRPALTADCVVFRGDTVLLIKRGKEPFAGRWALPGGFVNEGESADQAAERELEEETGVKGVGVCLREVGVFTAPGRDPRGWVVSVAHFVDLTWHEVPVQAADDAADAAWVPLSEASGLAFDHDQILQAAMAARSRNDA
jgi:8-oxo-dGTP diphosphatase